MLVNFQEFHPSEYLHEGDIQECDCQKDFGNMGHTPLIFQSNLELWRIGLCFKCINNYFKQCF